MAWGNPQQFYGYNRKCQAWVEWSVTSSNSTSATFSVTGCARSGDGSGYYYASGYSVEVRIFYRIGSGPWVQLGSTTGELNYNDSVGWITRSVTIQRTASSQPITFATDAVAPYGDWPTASAYLGTAVNPISYSTPNPPSGCSATRMSDSAASVSWSNGATDATHPRDATLVERIADAGGYAQVASVPSAASSYADNGIEANHRYRYRVRAQNSAGYSAYSESGYIYTTPAAPSSVSAAKASAATVTVDAVAAAPYATGYDIEKTTDGGATWASVASNTQLPYTDTVTGGTVRYRVRSVRGSLASAWALSPELVTITAPLAPTISAQPPSPSATGSAATIAWLPNHPDGTAQTKAQVKVTSPGGAPVTHTVDGPASSYTFTTGSTGTWTAQVRTYGLASEWGAWSEAVSWSVHSAPVIVITSPASDGAAVTSMPLAIAWTATDAMGVSVQRVDVSDSGGAIYTARPAADARSLSISGIALSNGGSYTIKLHVTGGSGLTATVTRAFIVDWIPPAAPALAIAEGESGSACIGVTYGENLLPANLSPFFSHDLGDVYDALNNPHGYWTQYVDTASYQRLTDGWVSYSLDNSSGTGSVDSRYRIRTIPDGFGDEDRTVTLLVEVRDASWTGSAPRIYCPYSLDTVMISPASFTVGASYEIRRFVLTAKEGSFIEFFYGLIRVPAGSSASLDLRLSLYEGEYGGDYVPYGMPPTGGVSVSRIIDGVPWTIAEDVADGAVAIDPLPPMGVPVEYRAVAIAVSGAASSTFFSALLATRDWILNFGPAAQESISFRYNPDARSSLDQGGAAYHFADGGAGGGLPVWYGTTDRDEHGSIGFDTADPAEADRLIDLCWRHPVAWIRDPFGHRWRARVKPSVRYGAWPLWHVDIGWEAVRFWEAW